MPTNVADKLNHAAGCWLRAVTYSSKVLAVPRLEPFTALAMAAALDTAELDALAASKADVRTELAYFSVPFYAHLPNRGECIGSMHELYCCCEI